MHITVVLPTYNEAENIVEIVSRVKSAVPQARILIIDDDSPDGTGKLAEGLAEEFADVEVLHRTTKDGLGSAYRFGFAHVFARADSSDKSVIVTMDADLSHDPAVIPTMLATIEGGADAVIGSRYVTGGGTVNWPFHRRLLSKWGNRYTSAILGLHVGDCTSGFRMYRSRVLESIHPETTTAEGYAFLTELIMRLAGQHARIREVPITFVDRSAGKSKMSARIIIESMTLVTRWGLTRGRRHSSL